MLSDDDIQKRKKVVLIGLLAAFFFVAATGALPQLLDEDAPPLPSPILVDANTAELARQPANSASTIAPSLTETKLPEAPATLTDVTTPNESLNNDLTQTATNPAPASAIPANPSATGVVLTEATSTPVLSPLVTPTLTIGSDNSFVEPDTTIEPTTTLQPTRDATAGATVNGGTNQPIAEVPTPGLTGTISLTEPATTLDGGQNEIDIPASEPDNAASSASPTIGVGESSVEDDDGSTSTEPSADTPDRDATNQPQLTATFEPRATLIADAEPVTPQASVGEIAESREPEPTPASSEALDSQPSAEDRAAAAETQGDDLESSVDEFKLEAGPPDAILDAAQTESSTPTAPVQGGLLTDSVITNTAAGSEEATLSNGNDQRQVSNGVASDQVSPSMERVPDSLPVTGRKTIEADWWIILSIAISVILLLLFCGIVAAGREEIWQ